jgi:hypothetical protein
MGAHWANLQAGRFGYHHFLFDVRTKVNRLRALFWFSGFLTRQSTD